MGEQADLVSSGVHTSRCVVDVQGHVLIRLYGASVLKGVDGGDASLPAMARRFLPCTPARRRSPRIGEDRHSLRTFFQPRRSFSLPDRAVPPIAVVLALHAGSHAAEDGSDHVVLGRHHRKRRVREERVAGADCMITLPAKLSMVKKALMSTGESERR